MIFYFPDLFLLLFVLLVMKEKGMFVNSWLNIYIFFNLIEIPNLTILTYE